MVPGCVLYGSLNFWVKVKSSSWFSEENVGSGKTSKLPGAVYHTWDPALESWKRKGQVHPRYKMNWRLP